MDILLFTIKLNKHAEYNIILFGFNIVECFERIICKSGCLDVLMNNNYVNLLMERIKYCK